MATEETPRSPTHHHHLPDPASQQVQQVQLQPEFGVWQQGIGYLHERQGQDKVRFCSACQSPIAVYGRLVPCKHAYCLECATDMPICIICRAPVNMVERVATPMFVSAATLQSFHTEEEFASSTRVMCRKLMQKKPYAEALAQHQQTLRQQRQVQQDSLQLPLAGAGTRGSAATAEQGLSTRQLQQQRSIQQQ